MRQKYVYGLFFLFSHLLQTRVATRTKVFCIFQPCAGDTVNTHLSRHPWAQAALCCSAERGPWLSWAGDPRCRREQPPLRFGTTSSRAATYNQADQQQVAKLLHDHSVSKKRIKAKYQSFTNLGYEPEFNFFPSDLHWLARR